MPIIRPAAAADASRLLALRLAVFDETPNMLFSAADYGGSEAHELKQIEWFAEQANSCLLLAEDAGELVGFLGLIGGLPPRIHHCADLFIGVRRAHWGQGVARKLIQAAIATAREMQLSRLQLTVNVTNPRAIKLYEGMGFQREGVLRNAIQIHGQMIDQFAMALTPL